MDSGPATVFPPSRILPSQFKGTARPMARSRQNPDQRLKVRLLLDYYYTPYGHNHAVLIGLTGATAGSLNRDTAHVVRRSNA